MKKHFAQANIRRIKIISSFVLIVTVVMMAVGFSTFNFRLKDDVVLRRFARSGQEVKIGYADAGERMIRYVSTLDDRDVLVVFVHGAPGSSFEYYSFMKDERLRAACRMIAVDRPGYGYSGFGRPETSVYEQGGQLLKVVREEAGDRDVIICGHSFGGPVSSAMAMQDSVYIDHLILLAPAVDPERERDFWFARLANWRPVYLLMSRAFRVAVQEKNAHEEALLELMPHWKDIDVPVHVLHGMRDKIIPVENADFLEQQLSHTDLTVIREPRYTHAVQIRNKGAIRDLILSVIEESGQ